jgi:hypothetical protein
MAPGVVLTPSPWSCSLYGEAVGFEPALPRYLWVIPALKWAIRAINELFPPSDYVLKDISLGFYVLHSLLPT